MNRLAENEMKRWLVAGVCAFFVMALGVMLFRAPPAPGTPTAVTATLPPVLLRPADGSDAAFDEKKILADPKPLFLPTSWNATPKAVPRPEPGARFKNLSDREGAIMPATELKLNLPPPVAVPSTPVAALLMDKPGSALAGFGRAAAALPVLPSRGAFVEIVTEGTGRAVLRQALHDVNPPGGELWQPMQFLVAVDAAGLVGAVSLTQHSGVEGVDDYFQRYLAQTLRVGQRLAPGFYRISVGP
jgi:hypothetical protein